MKTWCVYTDPKYILVTVSLIPITDAKGPRFFPLTAAFILKFDLSYLKKIITIFVKELICYVALLYKIIGFCSMQHTTLKYKFLITNYTLPRIL